MKSEVEHYSPQVRAALLLIALGVTVFLLWKAYNVIFVIFAGMLLGAILHHTACYLVGKTPLTHHAALLTLYAIIAVILAAVFLGGGAAIATQINELISAINAQVAELNALLEDLGYEGGIGDSLFPGTGAGFASMQTAATYSMSAVGNLFVVVFIGAFVSWIPSLYRRGALSLVPKDQRDRFGETLDDAAHRLASWSVGQGIAMIVIFSATWLLLWLIGMPYSFALALQAGLLAFIPTIGPLLAGIPMVLAGATVSGSMAMWALGVYLLVQLIESNFLTPLVQRRTTALAPALTLSMQLVFGAIFGLGGMMMAVPMLAAIVVFIERYYIVDALGGWASGDEDEDPEEKPATSADELNGE